MRETEARIEGDMDPFVAARQIDTDEIVELGELRAYLAALVEMAYQNTGYRRVKNPRIWSMHDLARAGRRPAMTAARSARSRPRCARPASTIELVGAGTRAVPHRGCESATSCVAVSVLGELEVLGQPIALVAPPDARGAVDRGSRSRSRAPAGRFRRGAACTLDPEARLRRRASPPPRPQPPRTRRDRPRVPCADQRPLLRPRCPRQAAVRHRRRRRSRRRHDLPARGHEDVPSRDLRRRRPARARACARGARRRWRRRQRRRSVARARDDPPRGGAPRRLWRACTTDDAATA